jgi:hypothetical protein
MWMQRLIDLDRPRLGLGLSTDEEDLEKARCSVCGSMRDCTGEI